MKREFTFIALLFILGVVWSEAQSCSSCGSECTSACGTRHFRTCCFNYLRKRSPPLPLMDPTLGLQLWLSRSGYPYPRQADFAGSPPDGGRSETVGEAED